MVLYYVIVSYATETVLCQDIAIKDLWCKSYCQDHELTFLQPIVVSRHISSPLSLEHTCLLLFLSLTHGKDQCSDCLMEALVLVIDP